MVIRLINKEIATGFANLRNDVVIVHFLEVIIYSVTVITRSLSDVVICLSNKKIPKGFANFRNDVLINSFYFDSCSLTPFILS